jgi:hypothetical protein
MELPYPTDLSDLSNKAFMNHLLRFLKPLVRWSILGGTLFFLAKVLRDHWQEVVAIRVSAVGWACLMIALGLTLFAHILGGWVWSRTLQELQQPIQPVWIVQAYLKTNIAKYLPGNVWHYYGRVNAAKNAGASLEVAALSVLLEPVLMLAAALFVTLLCSQQLFAQYGLPALAVQCLALVGVLAAVHPRCLNPLLALAGKLKQKGKLSATNQMQTMAHYPLIPLLGELGFVLLRAGGFLMTFLAVNSINLSELSLLVSAFSLAWMLGMVVPGAPGGVGVFEATAIALLGTRYSPAILLSIVALYRLISVLAEAIGAGLAWLDEQS